MINSIAQFAKQALQSLTDYCEYMEEENIRLAKENEELEEKAQKAKEGKESQKKDEMMFVLPAEMAQKVREHNAKCNHSGFTYTFGPSYMGTWYNVKCDRCTWEVDEFQ